MLLFVCFATAWVSSSYHGPHSFRRDRAIIGIDGVKKKLSSWVIAKKTFIFYEKLINE